MRSFRIAGLTALLLIIFVAITSYSKLIPKADAFASPLTCKKTSLPSSLKALNFCNPAVKIIDKEKEASAPKLVEKKKEEQPVHASVAYFYTPPPQVSTSPTQPQTSVSQTHSPSGELNTETIFNLINDHRRAIGLAPFEKDQKLCDIAISRIPELPQEAASGNYHHGLYARALPYWITENMKYGSDEAGTVIWWLNSPIHRAAMEGDYRYSCGASVGDIAIELFTNWSPKGGITLPSITPAP